MALLLSTTGTLDPVVINDLGARTFSHPTVNLNLELEYPLWQLVGSYDLSSALASGYITLTFDGSTFLTTTSLATISRGNMETFVYDPNASGIVNAASTSGAATLLNGFSGSREPNRNTAEWNHIRF